MKRILLIISFLLITIIVCLAQEDGRYIDFKVVRMQLTNLKELKIKLQNHNAELTKENNNLTQNVEEYNRSLNEEVEPLLANVVATMKKLQTLKESLVDSDMIKQADENFATAADLKRRTELKRQKLRDAIFEANTTIEKNNRQISINKDVITRNTEIIDFLEKSLEKTGLQEDTLNEYIGDISDFLKEAESLLSDIESPSR
jgi:chromosome segregation ATPase